MRKTDKTNSKKTRISSERGFTLLETMLAIFILGIGLLGTASMQGMSLRADTTANRISEGVNYGQEKMEELLQGSYTDTDIDIGDHTDNSPPTGYTITWSVEVGPVSSSKKITLDVLKGSKTITQFTCVKSEIY